MRRRKWRSMACKRAAVAKAAARLDKIMRKVEDGMIDAFFARESIFARWAAIRSAEGHG